MGSTMHNWRDNNREKCAAKPKLSVAKTIRKKSSNAKKEHYLRKKQEKDAFIRRPFHGAEYKNEMSLHLNAWKGKRLTTSTTTRVCCLM